MTRRFAIFLFLALVTVAVLFAPVPAAAQTSSPVANAAPAVKNWTPPKTPDGQPDLQGVWSTATNTPLQRPANLGAKEFYTPDELATRRNGGGGRGPGRGRPQPGTTADVHYDVSQYGLTQKVVAQDLRTSLIVGPEGRVPPLTPEAQKKMAERAAFNRVHQWDGPETRPLAERCITWPSEGPPMLSPGYNSDLQIVQGPGYVAILQEMIHDVRMIPTDGRPHLPTDVHQWFGDSRGHWEGNTLVVDATNFTGKTTINNTLTSTKLHVTERYTRTGPDTLLYQFTVDDPDTWTKSWSAEVPWEKTKGPIYEYACQEGNYGMANNLSGARASEKKAAEEAAGKGN